MKTTTTMKKIALSLAISGFCMTTSIAQCLVTTGPTNNCGYGDAIDNFTINGITASNPGCSGSQSGYTAFASPTWTFHLDSSYALSANLGGAQYQQGLAIWIDINNDGVYAATEQVYNSTVTGLTQVGTVVIPATGAVNVPLPMRVMCVYNADGILATNACSSNQGSYGETEDYMVTLTTPSPPSNVAATAILQPAISDCGTATTEIWAQVANTTITDELNIPVVVNVSGMLTNSFNVTIPSIMGNTTVDILVGTVDTEAGGTLDIQFYTDFIDDDANDDTLVTSIAILDATDLDLVGLTETCEGDSIEFSLNNGGIETYTWTLDGATVGDTTDVYQSSALAMDGQIVVSSDNSCRANDTLDFTVNPLPTGSFSSSISLNVVDFTGTATDEDGVYWDFGDGTGVGTSLTEQYTYAQNGTYTVCMYSYNDCDTVEFCEDVIIAGVGLLELATGSIKVYPNPTAGMVTVTLSDMIGFNGDWALIDVNGRQIDNGQIVITADKTELNLNLSNFAKGTYVFKLSNKHGQSKTVNLIRE